MVVRLRQCHNYTHGHINDISESKKNKTVQPEFCGKYSVIGTQTFSNDISLKVNIPFQLLPHSFHR